MKRLVVCLVLALVTLDVAYSQIQKWDIPDWVELGEMEFQSVQGLCHPQLPVVRLTEQNTIGMRLVPFASHIRCVPARGYFLVDIICRYATGCAKWEMQPQLAFDLELRLRIPTLFME